nr:hypothetical protein [Bacilli bacterium]
MLEKSIEILKEIESNGFEAFIVGGFVRDYYIGKESYDVDICTNAKPKDLINIFSDAILPKEKYGAVTLYYKDIRYEITTYRKEISYRDRKPIELEYTNDFEGDINRRDFKMNTLCMNSKKEIIDILNGKDDIDKKIISTVGNPDKKFKEDPLRILRAIRFATQLNFKLESNTLKSIKRNGYLLESLSYSRKKEELNKIFINTNSKCGIRLLIVLNLSKYLELDLKKIKITTDVLGIWAQLNVLNKYPFSKIEKDTIIVIQEIIKNTRINKFEIYKYGLYNSLIAAEILGISKKIILKI